MKKIVLIGPESTGKSFLCEQLAAHFNTLWCPEYARDYLNKNGKEYTYSDLLAIAKGQIENEEQYLRRMEEMYRISKEHSVESRKQGSEKHDEPFFIDTDMYVMKVWCEFVFGKCHSFITDTIASRQYDLYLLCNTDLPWVKDELREYPDEIIRKELYSIYKNLLSQQTTPWIEISGSNDLRIIQAVQSVEKFCFINQ